MGAIINKERPELFGRLAPLIGPTPMEVLGDIHNPPLGKSFARLSKKLTHFHYTLCCNELWAKRDTLPETVRYAWMRNLPGSVLPSPRGFRAKVLGCDAYRGVPLPPCRTACSAGDFNSGWDATLQELVANARGQAAALLWTPLVFMLRLAIGVRFASDMTDYVIYLLRPPARRVWPRSQNRT